MADAPHLDGEASSIDGTWRDIGLSAVLVAEQLGRCFAEQDFDTLGDLYAGEAKFELHVGAEHDLRIGRDQIRLRYAQDFAVRPAFERWDCTATSRGAVVEAEALQDSPGGPLRFHWVHLLHVSGGRIQRDTVYCTGGVISESTLARPG